MLCLLLLACPRCRASKYLSLDGCLPCAVARRRVDEGVGGVQRALTVEPRDANPTRRWVTSVFWAHSVLF